MTFGALSFGSPFILLALLGLPVIWLIMRATPPQPRQQAFPGFILLKRLPPSEETPARTPWVLLLLRLLAATLLIVGLAAPVLNAPPSSQKSGPMIIIVDNTWPAAPGWRLRRNALSEMIEELKATRRPAYLVTTSPRLTPLPWGLLSADDLSDQVKAITPSALAPDYTAARDLIDALPDGADRYDVRWLTDGVEWPGHLDLARTLAAKGDVTIIHDTQTATPWLLRQPGAKARYRIGRITARDALTGIITANARDGRELARAPFAFDVGAKFTDATLDLPLALRNDIAVARIDGVNAASATHLADGRDRRQLIGVINNTNAVNRLLSGDHFARTALSPYAEFVSGDLDTLLQSSVTTILLDDIGRLRASDVTALLTFIEEGGVVIRFAGEILAEVAQEPASALQRPSNLEPDDPSYESLTTLLPAPLRGGGRAFGGALTWETPQLLGEFTPNGPFEGLTPPDDVFVRRQVLAVPGGATSARTWASLKDGTPLVTGLRRGNGALALFHVTATSDWSDLPLSGVFVDMLHRLITLGASTSGGRDTDEPNGLQNGAQNNAAPSFPPLRILDGFGNLNAAPAELTGVTISEAEQGPALSRPPGLYGSPDAPFAINVASPADDFQPLNLELLERTGAITTPYIESPPQRLAPPLFLIGLLLILLDALAVLGYAGKLRWRSITARRNPAAARPRPNNMVTSVIFLFGLGVTLLAADTANAQPAIETPLDPPISQTTLDAATTTRLAFVRTGDDSVDRLSERGLASLSLQLTRRTSIEPGQPTGINLETDDLSVFPFLYWPMIAGAPTPSETALANIESFMRSGGLVLLDTRDDERAIAGVSTPERQALQNVLLNINTPPLQPLPGDHVLTRSFYLLGDLPGRLAVNPVWVQAGGDANDGVTPLIIGGRDWAGAWASEQTGRPILPMPRGGERAREYAYRAGINIIMVALTGNYKSDQVHTPILLERLGQ